VNRSEQTKAIFAELKRTFGSSQPAGALLRLAATIVATYRTRDTDVEALLHGSTLRSFFAREVDKAMEDGGWRIMDFECAIGMSLCDELPDNYLVIENKIQQLIGRTEWPRIETVWL
jgi:hypothetical protein